MKGDDIQKSVSETFKYAVKFWKQTKSGETIRVNPVLVPVLASVLKGQKRVRTYGLLYGVPEPDDCNMHCNVCGVELLRWSAMEWDIYRMTGWTPAEYDSERAGTLDLRHGNNFGREPPENVGCAPILQQTTLPGIGAQSHYTL